MHNKIFLAGFRATGKTTVGFELARELGWEFIDMDDEIVRRTGQSISEMTEGGKSWQSFRQWEQDVLAELLRRENVVVAMGGGVLVNNVVKEGTSVTFGRRNADMLIADVFALTVLLTASDEIIFERMKADLLNKEDESRPILDERRAKEVELKMAKYADNPDKRQALIVDEILKDSMNIYRERKPLYDGLAQVVVDTGKLGPVEAAKEIIKKL